jgi:predicted DNA-binding transcriptional regulator AlpA
MMDAPELARRVPLEALDEVAAEDLPAVALYLAALQNRIAARSLAAADTRPMAVSRNGPEALLDVREAAARLNVSTDWLYRRAKRLPFSRRVGPRAVRFDPAGLARWVATRTPRRS